MVRLNNEQVSSGIWLSIGVVIVLASIGHRLGSFDSPDTGFMPFLVGLAMCFFSFIGLVHGTLKQKRGVGWEPIMKGLMWGKTLIVMGALIAYAVLMNHLGFILCTFLFLVLLFKSVKPTPWIITIVSGTLITLATYVIFEIWLQSRLPKGPWGF